MRRSSLVLVRALLDGRESLESASDIVLLMAVSQHNESHREPTHPLFRRTCTLCTMYRITTCREKLQRLYHRLPVFLPSPWKKRTQDSEILRSGSLAQLASPA
jgi:hypothetical protein